MKHSFINKKKDKFFKKKEPMRLPKKTDDLLEEKDVIKLPKKTKDLSKEKPIKILKKINENEKDPIIKISKKINVIEKDSYIKPDTLYKPHIEMVSFNIVEQLNEKKKRELTEKKDIIDPDVTKLWHQFRVLERQYPLGVSRGGGSITNIYRTDEEYTDVLFVSPNGDDSDGSTWIKAYTTIQGALSACSTNANRFTLIIIAPGIYDINMDGDPEFSANVKLWGQHRHFVIIKNDHKSSSSVLKFTGKTVVYNLSIDCGAGNNGLIFDNADGSRAYKLHFDSMSAITSVAPITLMGGIIDFKSEDIIIHGEKVHTTGIYIHEGSYVIFKDVVCYNCVEGIYIKDNCDYSTFDDVRFIDCVTGISIESAALENAFHHFDFYGCGTNITDSGSGTIFNTDMAHIDNYVNKILPAGVDGGVMVTSAADETEGTIIEIVAGTSFTKPFWVTGFYMYDNNIADKNYLVSLYHGTTTHLIHNEQIMGGKKFGGSVEIHSDIFPAGENILAGIAVQDGGSKTTKLQVYYVEI